MEVTQENFISLLPSVKKAINEASFIAIDGEFTGLSDGPRANPFDTPEQYFEKIRHGCSEFLLIQFGLCAFKYDQTKKRFVHTAYNFYTFPNPINRNVPDFRFRCQSSSLNFLALNNFDFNKLFKSGIPFLTQEAEEALQEEISDREKSLLDSSISTKAPGTPISVPEEFKEDIGNACNKLQKLLDDGKPGDTVEIEEPRAFVRKLIYQAVEKEFSEDPLIVETKKLEKAGTRNYRFALVGTKGQSKQELEKIKAEKGLEELKSRLQETVGFSAVIRLLSESGKLIVGHNMFLDIFYTISQFCTPLSSNYEEFKEIVHFTLPKLIDTKLMCALAPLKDLIKSSVLPHLLETVQTEPFEIQSMEVEGAGYSINSRKEHEAGYDAFVTGVCFIAMYDHLNSLKKNDAMDYSSSYLVNSPTLKDFINKIFLMKRYDSPFLNLAGRDPTPFRKNVFHTTFPREWQTHDIINLFSAFSEVDIVWISDTSAWVSLTDRSNSTIQKVMKNLVDSSEVKQFTVRTFAQYQELLSNLSTPTNSEKRHSRPYSFIRKRKFNTSSNEVQPSRAEKIPRTEPPLLPASLAGTDLVVWVQHRCHPSLPNKQFRSDNPASCPKKDSSTEQGSKHSLVIPGSDSSSDDVADEEDDKDESDEIEGEEEDVDEEIGGNAHKEEVVSKSKSKPNKKTRKRRRKENLFAENDAWE